MYSSKVILWDNWAKKYVTYGYVEASSTARIIPVITTTEWHEVSELYVQEIFLRTALWKNRP